jgi:hypothetical protein
MGIFYKTMVARGTIGRIDMQLKKVIRAFRNQCVLEKAHGYWTKHGF